MTRTQKVNSVRNGNRKNRQSWSEEHKNSGDLSFRQYSDADGKPRKMSREKRSPEFARNEKIAKK